jgi:hypothetical protein
MFPHSLMAQARADLSHINAAIAIFKVSGDRAMMPPYADIHWIFKHGEIGLICKRALTDEGTLDTRWHCASYAPRV